MSSPIFSIIIPMYKVAVYLTRCIESLEQQDIPRADYEIICINDGSPDNCKEIVEDLQKKYANIILLNQENQGVSVARNNGIAIAKGKYILPIDPDDYVVPNTFGRILNLVEKLNCEVLYLGFEIFDANQNSIWKSNYSRQNHQLFDGVDGYFLGRGFEVKDPDRSWAILYKKEMLDAYKIVYPKNVPYLEDGLFLAKVFAVAKKVSFDNEIFYQRTTRIGSATNSKLFYSEKTFNGFLLAINEILNFRELNQLNINQQNLINQIHAKFFLHLLAPSALSFRYKEFNIIVKKIKEKNLRVKNKNGISPINKRLISIFNFSPLLFYIYYPLLIKKRNKN